MTFSPNSRPLLPVIAVLGGAAYPFIVYALLGRVPAGGLVLAALALVAARLVGLRGSALARPLLLPLAAVAALMAALGLVDGSAAAQAYPIVMSLGMAAAFGLSLLRPPCLVECFAAVVEPTPTEAARAYMRRVTWVWFGFLLGNAALSAASLASGSLELWTLYNGLVSYLLMAALFGGEWLVRRRVRRREAGR